MCCISYYSYIKPQLCRQWNQFIVGCISYYSYIKPQLASICLSLSLVVYHTIPTSNHNQWLNHKLNLMLYIILFLHQTTTRLKRDKYNHKLYIILFLHQTTTSLVTRSNPSSCISYYSYIKPQPIMLI